METAQATVGHLQDRRYSRRSAAGLCIVCLLRSRTTGQDAFKRVFCVCYCQLHPWQAMMLRDTAFLLRRQPLG